MPTDELRTRETSVSECRRMKRDLETEITRLCYEFAFATGMKVTMLDVVDDPSMQQEGSRFYVSPSIRATVEL